MATLHKDDHSSPPTKRSEKERERGRGTKERKKEDERSEKEEEEEKGDVVVRFECQHRKRICW